MDKRFNFGLRILKEKSNRHSALGKKRPFRRRLALENLEERALLAVTAGFESAPIAEISANMADQESIPVESVQIETAETESAIEMDLEPAATSKTYTVTTLTDVVSSSDGVLSLREAITSAVTGDKIIFASSLSGGTITLAGTELAISAGITIDASSLSAGIKIDANAASRIFSISGGTSATPVTLISLTLQNGDADNGGAIYNGESSQLVLENCVVTGNYASNKGGAIINWKASLTLTNCKVTENSSDGHGGGIYNNYGYLAAVNSLFTEQTVEGYGGAFYNNGSLALTNCTVAGNTSGMKKGSGIYNLTLSGETFLYNTIVCGNTNNDITRTSGTIFGYNSLSSYTDSLSFTSEENFVYDSSKPLFADAAGGDYSLTADSQAIDLGLNEYMPATSDLAGQTRRVNGTVDLGAYEYQGVVLTVTTLADTVNASDGVLSLREAINAASAGTRILFDSSLSGGTITLSGKELAISAGITIDASSLASGLTIDGGAASRIFSTSGGSAAAPIHFIGLTLQNGKSDSGGAIFNFGVLTLTNCSVTGSVSTSFGGGILNFGTLTLENTVVAKNTAATTGGGINNFSGTLTLVNCTLAKNTAATGGGLYLGASAAQSVLYNSIIVLNTASSSGANIQDDSGKIAGYFNLTTFTDWASGSGNIAYSAQKTLFTNASGGDFTLADDSQAIDVGKSAYVTTATDRAGNIRIVRAAVDIGAYEYQGVTIWVTTLADTVSASDGVLSLREAITQASEGDVIGFASSLAGGTIKLSGSELVVEKGITITAAGLLGGITIDGGFVSGVFDLSGGTESNPVELIGLTIQKGYAFAGGGVDAHDVVKITDCVIVNNTAFYYGGGIFSYGDLTLTNCTIAGNYADYGSGVYNYKEFHLENTVIALNYSDNLYGVVDSVVSSVVSNDPGFVAAPIFNDDGSLANAVTLNLRLRKTSWLINSGDNSCVTSSGYDNAMNLRIYDETVDIGAYEYQRSLPTREAASLVVTTKDDTMDATDGQTSLREAIFHAKAGETVTFLSGFSGATITLVDQGLDIIEGISIDASALYKSVTIDANQLGRVLYFTMGETSQASLNHITFKNGLTNDMGGGILFNRGSLTMTDCAVTGNTTTFCGGGIYNEYETTLTLINTSITGNSAAEDGGGLLNYCGNAVLTNCVISGNTAKNGGGIFLTGKTTLTNVTVAGNSASISGGGITNSPNYSGELHLQNSIVAMNYQENLFGILNSSSHSILTADPGFVVAPVFNESGTLTNSKLLNLQLASTSWLIDAGENSFVTTQKDLAGNTRLYGAAVDLGAYEYQAAAPERESVSLVVTTSVDSMNATDGKTSLREALYHSQPGDVITFDSSLSGCVISMAKQEFDLSDNITIDASALADGVTLNAQSSSRVFYVNAGEGKSISLIGLTMKNGKNAYHGGGIYVHNGSSVTLTNCSLIACQAEYGGALTVHSGGTAAMTGCVFMENYADYGGVFYNDEGTITLLNCDLSENSSRCNGGVIFNDFGGQLTMTNCVASDNKTGYCGGVIINYMGHLLLSNCTFAANDAQSGAVIYNNAPFLGEIYNSIFALNTHYYDICCDIVNVEETFIGRNNISDATDWSEDGSANNRTYDESKPLFTNIEECDWTLCEGSQALDVGNNADVTVSMDLAGKRRISNGIVDLGAYELQVGPTPLDAPTGLTYVSDGANRALIYWGPVANASGYTLAYSADGTSWTEISSASCSTILTGLTYGTQYAYKVRALAAAESGFDDSDYSASISYYLCPMDINSDGSIDLNDYRLFSASYMKKEGETGYDFRCNIDGVSKVNIADWRFLSKNFNKTTADPTLYYPAPLASLSSAAVDKALTAIDDSLDWDLRDDLSDESILEGTLAIDFDVF